ncbi:MAG: thioesterase family protein [Solirubrobacteraceae bacterium]|nr:thioesterase family protein [Solirubrobacteraceae bacterium]
MAFYEPIDESTFASTADTAGPWSPDAQHGGPPSALLTRALETAAGGDGRRLARVAIDLLGPVPIAPLRVTTTILRPGRAVELVEAVAEANGRPVVAARGWRVARVPETTPGTGHGRPVGDDPAAGLDPATTGRAPAGGRGGVDVAEVEPADLPDRTPHVDMAGFRNDGFVGAVDWRFAKGGFSAMGPGLAWARTDQDLVAGEPMSPWQRAVIVADAGSGVSISNPPHRWPAINCDLVVALYRDPVGPWIGLDSRTDTRPGEGAHATTTILDAHGPVGAGLQSLLVRELPA